MGKYEETGVTVRQEREKRLNNFEEIKSMIVDKVKEILQKNGQVIYATVEQMFRNPGVIIYTSTIRVQ